VVRSLIAILLAAAACNVGPSYVRPKVALNPAWSEQSDPRLAAATAVDVAWWKTFADPTLDHLIELAYHQNLSLQIAGLRILEARAQLGVAIGDQWPSSIGPIMRGAAVGVSEHAAGGAGIDRRYGEYQVGFDAVWEVDFWGKFRRGVSAEEAAYQATIADYDDALVALGAEVARAYVMVRTFEVLIEQARQNAELQVEGLHIAESRFKNGATSELDVAQATNLLETTRASIPPLQISLVQTKNALSTLLGRTTGYVDQVLGDPAGVVGVPAPPAKVAIGVPGELLLRRPDIRAAELRAIAQCNRIGIAKAELFPRLVLFGLIGSQTTSGAIPGSSFTNLFGAGSLAYNLGGSLFWPILNYPRNIANVRVEDARFQQALVAYVQTVLEAAQEAEDGITGYLRQQDAVVFAQNAVTAADTAVKLALIQYREGAVDYQRVLDSQRERLDSQSRLTDTRSAAATNLIALYKALGGGWELRVGQPVVPEAVQREMQDRTWWGGYFSRARQRRR
jgi:NodT family efflux transporter outer membrane factor (OMF) lipoprotein